MKEATIIHGLTAMLTGAAAIVAVGTASARSQTTTLGPLLGIALFSGAAFALNVAGLVQEYIELRRQETLYHQVMAFRKGGQK